MATKLTPAAALVEDMALYPRQHIDDVHVADLARALEAKTSMPPIVADAKTKQIIDGVHRRRAFMRAFGDKVKIPVDFRSYAGDKERLAAAIELNSAHGLRLTRQDEIRCVLLGKRIGLEDKEIALHLHVTPERVEQIGVRVVYVNGEALPAKRVAAHRYGESVSRSTAEAYSGFSGIGLLQHVNQLLGVIETGGYDEERQEVLDALWRLARTIQKNVPVKAVRAKARLAKAR